MPMDYITFCKNYFAITGLPINLVNNNGVLYSSLADLLHIPAVNPVVIWPAEYNPEFRCLSSDNVYGSVQIEGTDNYVMLGPIFSIPVTKNLVRRYMKELTIPSGYEETLMEFLTSVPRLTHLQFCQHLVFLHQCLNNKEISVLDIINQRIPSAHIQNEQHIKTITNNIENECLHNTYYFELELFHHISSGNVNSLREFLSSTPSDLTEGKYAQTPLRHTKNLFIGTATKIEMLGAIPGGIDIENAYQLVELYIQECERLNSIEEIYALLYSMAVDFCQRAGEAKIATGISREICECINYIRTHTNSPVSVDDVAWNIKKSNSYVMKKFKEELGFTVGSFITRCKLEEAKGLLTYSDKTLAEISSYLCFSSQPHFQSLFKKQYQMTPLEYRKKTRAL